MRNGSPSRIQVRRTSRFEVSDLVLRIASPRVSGCVDVPPKIKRYNVRFISAWCCGSVIPDEAYTATAPP
jgi:hypothetical protein